MMLRLLFIGWMLIIGLSVHGQEPVEVTDTVKSATDTISMEEEGLEDVVEYFARDSMRMDIPAKKVYLFGAGQVNYQEIILKADLIEFSFDTRVVTATYLADSAGNKTGRPEFTDGAETFTADRIDYNFDTRKGIIYNVRTQVTEGFIDAEVVKKDTGKVLYIGNGSFCPCDDPDALTRFRIKKLKVMDELIVTGPGYLEIGGIPTPLAFPFGFFPNKKKQSAGIIIPTYGESPVLGFFLQKGGYYWPVNDKFDTQFLGDIYSRGSWGLHNLSRYKVRYKYEGQFDISYTVLKNGDPDFPDFSKNSTFFIRWTHNQDPKARPGTTFRANVNLGSVDNFQNTFSSNVNDYLSNTFNSSIAWSKGFTGTPFSVAVNARHSQNSQNRQVTVALPELALNMNRIYPLGKLGPSAGSRKWYQQIGLTLRTDATNQVTAGDTLFSFNRFDELANQMRYGFRNSAGLNTAIKILKGKFTFNPSVNFVNRIYLQKVIRSIDASTNTVSGDTTRGFFTDNEFSASGALSTKLYGYFAFKAKYQPVKVIRHVITPQLNFRYRPQLVAPLSYTDTAGTVVKYSPFSGGIYGAASFGESGMLSLNIINTLDMKMKSESDTVTGLKKLKLIDNFNILASYDIFKDSLKFSTIQMNGRTTLFKVFNINFSGTLDPYQYVDGKAINQALWIATGRPARFTQGNLAGGFRLQSKKKKHATDRGALEQLGDDENEKLKDADPGMKAAIQNNPDAFIDFSIPWTLSINYSLNLNRSYYFINESYRDSARITQTVQMTGDLSLTEKWKVGFATGYDVQQKDFTFTSISVYRDLNCWEMSFEWIPFGLRRSYSIAINLKSSMLKDLKLQRRRSWFDNGFN
jgi:hypothetical protein